MRPYPEEVLRAIQTGVMTHFAPELTSSYAQAQFAFCMLLFDIVQQGYDSQADALVDENRELRALLADAAEALRRIERDDARAGREAIAALPGPAASLRLSELRAEHEARRDVLGRLAPLVEPAADVAELAPLRDVRARAFAYLSADAKRRTVPILTV